MPYLVLATNIKISQPKLFALDFSKFSAETLGKPEKYLSVNVTSEETLTFGGTFDPAFVLTVMSFDNLDPSANEVYSKKFFHFFKTQLGISGDRGYISFADPGRAFIGYQGTTLATIFAK